MTWRVTITAFVHSPLDSDKKKFAKDLKKWGKKNNRISSNWKEWITALSFVTYTDLLDLVGQYWHETNSAWSTLQRDFSGLSCPASRLRERRRQKGVPSLSILEYIGTLATFPLFAQGAFLTCVRHAILGWQCICHDGAQARGGVSIGTAYLCSFTSRLSSTLN